MAFDVCWVQRVCSRRHWSLVRNWVSLVRGKSSAVRPLLERVCAAMSLVCPQGSKQTSPYAIKFPWLHIPHTHMSLGTICVWGSAMLTLDERALELNYHVRLTGQMSSKISSLIVGMINFHLNKTTIEQQPAAERLTRYP